MYCEGTLLNSYWTHQNANFQACSLENALAGIAQETGLVLFYDETDPLTEWLGNFYPLSITYNGLVFLNSEAAFQSQKFVNDPDLLKQFTKLTGAEAFRSARALRSNVRPDWLEVREQIMREVLIAKINQHAFIKRYLEATGEALLVEHNPVKGRDAVWSDDFDGTGQNTLGHLWMELRSEMRSLSIHRIKGGKIINN